VQDRLALGEPSAEVSWAVPGLTEFVQLSRALRAKVCVAEARYAARSCPRICRKMLETPAGDRPLAGVV